MTNNKERMERNKKYTIADTQTDFSLNVAGMIFSDEEISKIKEKFTVVHKEMQKIEAGEIKNPDENRKVTHFTDRAVYTEKPLFKEVESFAQKIRTGEIKGSTGKKFESVVINGIGGSALGPQLIQFTINGPYWNEMPENKRHGNLKIYFTDNTDSAGFNDILEVINLETTLIVNISKSGGTKETQNNMLAFKREYSKLGLNFAEHTCAITMKNSVLDKIASEEKWLKTFEMAESIGGRTSETNIVGHVPAALTGIDFESMLRGACYMDELTRNPELTKNPAYLLSAMWYIAGNGKGDKNMVIVPYSDRLLLLSRYLQQLVMESLGKEKDLDGNIVHQGLTVFGNKGGTDAHAFIQQLQDGRNDFFITFIEVLKDKMHIPVDGKVTMGDYLHGFLTGLTMALQNKKRETISISIPEVNEFYIGMIIALYERSVAAYAELIHINAFHQPGVQAYKLVSKEIIELTKQLLEQLNRLKGFSGTAEDVADRLNLKGKEIEIDGILSKFAANPDREFPGYKISAKRDETNKTKIYFVE